MQETLEQRLAFLKSGLDVSKTGGSDTVESADAELDRIEEEAEDEDAEAADGEGNNTDSEAKSQSDSATENTEKVVKPDKTSVGASASSGAVAAASKKSNDDEDNDDDQPLALDFSEDTTGAGSGSGGSNSDSESPRLWAKLLISQAPFFLRLNSPVGPLAVCASWLMKDSSKFRLNDQTDLELDLKLQKLTGSASSNFAIILMRAGRFSAAIYSSSGSNPTSGNTDFKTSTAPKMILHKNLSRYTVRAKQGGSQSAKDNTGKSIKSAGSQLRRYGEKALEADMKSLFKTWEVDLKKCGSNIFLSAGATQTGVIGKLFPESIQKGLGLMETDSKEKSQDSSHQLGQPHNLLKKIPFVVKKPNLEEVQNIALQLRQVHIYADEDIEKMLSSVAAGSGGGSGSGSGGGNTISGEEANAQIRAEQERVKKEERKRDEERRKQRAKERKENERRAKKNFDYEEEKDILFTELHRVCKAGDGLRMEELLEEYIGGLRECGDIREVKEGDSEKGRLEIAAGWKPVVRKHEVLEGKIQKGNDEAAGDSDEKTKSTEDTATIADKTQSEESPDPNNNFPNCPFCPISARDSKGRLPIYMLESHPKLREKLRKIRGQILSNSDEPGEKKEEEETSENSLGIPYELLFAWDSGNVPPAITPEKEDEKKAKEREKKKRQKANQKANKEKREQEAAEKKAKEEEEKRKEEELLKGPACTFCRKGCGADPNKWFRKQEYVYCKAECMRGHTRELAAIAAEKRFG